MAKRAKKRKLWLVAVPFVVLIVVFGATSLDMPFFLKHSHVSAAKEKVTQSGAAVVEFVETFKQEHDTWPTVDQIYAGSAQAAGWYLLTDGNSPALCSRYYPFWDSSVCYDFTEQAWQFATDGKRYYRGRDETEWHSYDSDADWPR